MSVKVGPAVAARERERERERGGGGKISPTVITRMPGTMLGAISEQKEKVMY